MARSSKNNKNEAANKYDFEFANTGIIRGVVNKVLYDGEKVKKYNIDVPTKTKNDKIAHAFVNVVEYSTDGALDEGTKNDKIAHAFVNVVEYSTDGALDEGTKVNIEFHIATGSYENKDGKKIFTTDIVADVIDEI